MVKGATMTTPTLERSTEQQLVAQLLRSPRLPAVAEHLSTLVADETARRQRFVDTVLESEMAKFINGEKIVHSPAKFKHAAAIGNLYRLLSSSVSG